MSFANLAPVIVSTSKSATTSDRQNAATWRALKTEKNDTYMQDAGTELYKLRHRMVATEQGFKRLQNEVEQIVKGILPDAKVVLVSKDYPASAYFRYETYVIEVYDDGTKIAELPI